MHLLPSGSQYPSRNTAEEIEHLEKGHKGKNRCYQRDDTYGNGKAMETYAAETRIRTNPGRY